jgi:hypothetical protein
MKTPFRDLKNALFQRLAADSCIGSKNRLR